MKPSFPIASIRAAGLAALLLAAAAAAQQQPAPAPSAPPAGERPVARLERLKGNVLVSRDSALVAGAEATPLVAGARVITTARSEVVVVYEDGCEVRLQENQRFEVETGKPCAALVAQSTVAPPPAAAVGSLAGLLVPGAVGAGGAYAALRDARDDRQVSPN